MSRFKMFKVPLFITAALVVVVVLAVVGIKKWEPTPEPTYTVSAAQEPLCNEGATVCVPRSYALSIMVNPITVVGTAPRVEESSRTFVYWVLMDATPQVIKSGVLPAGPPYGGSEDSFRLHEFFWNVPKTKEGQFSLFTEIDANGQPVRPLDIPVLFSTTTSTITTVEHTSSGTRQSVTIPKTVEPIEATIAYALETADPVARLLYFNVKEGVASVLMNYDLNDFTDKTKQRALLREVIKKTVALFPELKSVQHGVLEADRAMFGF